jgi:vacuolar-type H+-ATPase subunit E/Vma4
MEATRQFVGTGVGYVLVQDGSEVLDILDARDLATAKQTGQSGSSAVDVTGGTAVDSREGSVDDEYSSQSICEGCGSFSQDLINVDGQLLCPDCRTV